MKKQRILNIVPNLKYKKITAEIWDSIQDEGLHTEKKAYSKNNWEYAILPISKTDKNGLKRFYTETIEKFNDFDIQLKEIYHMRYIDLIDYDRGIVNIVVVKR